MRSLVVKLTLAFLVVSLTSIALVAALTRHATVAEFDQYVLQRAKSSFVSSAAEYFETHESWEGVDAYFHQRRRPQDIDLGPARPEPADGNPSAAGEPDAGSTMPGAAGPRPADGNSPGMPPFPPAVPGPPPPRQYFVLADQDGGVVISGGPYHAGDRLSEADFAKATAVEVDGQAVGKVLAAGTPLDYDPNEQRYLARTNQALLGAAVGATAIALILGLFLARTLIGPLRELTTAIHAMDKGRLKQRVHVRSRDELGELAAAFNQMSADLARANESRRQMTADIAHDLRTPLTVISGYIESLRDGVLKPSPAHFDAMQTEAQHLLRLVEDLRTLSLADTGELTLNRQPVSPRALLERLAGSYRHRAEQQGIDLRVQADPGLPEISVDPERMVQVLGNLISNALRYTPAGGRVVLSARGQAGALQLSVADTGKGIDADAMPHIFNRFYRGDTSRQQDNGESGLGLAIAKSLVELHGGQITVDSAPGRGSTFHIALPAG